MNVEIIVNDERNLRREVIKRLLDLLVKEDELDEATYEALYHELDMMYEMGAKNYYAKTKYESVIGFMCPTNTNAMYWENR